MMRFIDCRTFVQFVGMKSRAFENESFLPNSKIPMICMHSNNLQVIPIFDLWVSVISQFDYVNEAPRLLEQTPCKWKM